MRKRAAVVATSSRTRLSWVPDLAGAVVTAPPVPTGGGRRLLVGGRDPGDEGVGGGCRPRADWRGLAVGKSAELVEPTTTGVAAPRPDGDARGLVVLPPAQVAGRHQGGAGGGEGGDEGVGGAPALHPLEGLGGGEVGRAGDADHGDAADLVDEDAGAAVGPAPAQVGGVDELGPGRVDLGDEGVGVAVLAGLEGVRLDREVGRVGDAGDVGRPLAVDRDGRALVGVAAAEEGGVHQVVAGGAELGDEGVGEAAGHPAGRAAGARLQGPGGGEAGRPGVAGDVGVAGGVDGDVEAAVVVVAAQAGGEDERRCPSAATLVTKASTSSARGAACWKGLAVGNATELVDPVTNASPTAFTATARAASVWAPPRNVDQARPDPAGLSLVTKASLGPPP